MPELPEVEVARRNLHKWLTGATIRSVRAPTPPIAKGQTAAAFGRALVGKKVGGIDRRGKWLRIDLGDGKRLFSHLGMTGKWVARKLGDAEADWERARIDGARAGKVVSLRYIDPRRFGRLFVSDDDIAAWRTLGPDPLVDGLDGTVLQAALGKRRRAIKEALLDQTVVAGIGNIQATEALWVARLDPRSRADRLSTADCRALAKGIHNTIKRTLAHESGPEITYLQEAGAKNPFRIYGRAGTSCPRCGSTIETMTIGGRSSAFCGGCQIRRI